jgi:PadR family transcriptional regulator, regulatory protein PadR
MVRRKPGALLPLEVELLGVTIELQGAGQGDCYGYALAKALAAGGEARRLIAHGTLYKALGRLTDTGLLDSWWEDPVIAESERRPRRRLYRVTGAGVQAWSTARMAAVPAHSDGSTASGTAIPGTATA